MGILPPRMLAKMIVIFPFPPRGSPLIIWFVRHHTIIVHDFLAYIMDSQGVDLLVCYPFNVLCVVISLEWIDISYSDTLCT